MKQLAVLLLIFFWAGSALALEVAGVKLAPQVQVAGESLELNGYGIREKFFFKVYIGSLYTAQPAGSTEQVLAGSGGKLIRMDFVYRKLEKEKIVGGFAKGFANNSPALKNSQAAKDFLALFDADFVEGDQVDLMITADGRVSASHNGRLLGGIDSPALAQGVLSVFLGPEPVDDDMKEGMLGPD